jgi:hypothetical protein
MGAGPVEKLPTCESSPKDLPVGGISFLLRFFGLKNQERPDLQTGCIKLIIKINYCRNKNVLVKSFSW